MSYPERTGKIGIRCPQRKDARRCPTLTRGSPALPSAMHRFTSEFGMGSGGANALWPPDKSTKTVLFCIVFLCLYKLTTACNSKQAHFIFCALANSQRVHQRHFNNLGTAIKLQTTTLHQPLECCVKILMICSSVNRFRLIGLFRIV